MNHGLSDQVRSVALERFVNPAVRAGKAQFSVPVRDLMGYLEAEGFPGRNWPQVCTAIQAGKFLREHGLEIEGVDGPPKKQSPRVVVHYRLAGNGGNRELAKNPPPDAGGPAFWGESATARALRLSDKLRGLLKDELAEHGGGEAFLRWIRSEDEDAA